MDVMHGHGAFALFLHHVRIIYLGSTSRTVESTASDFPG